MKDNLNKNTTMTVIQKQSNINEYISHYDDLIGLNKLQVTDICGNIEELTALVESSEEEVYDVSDVESEDDLANVFMSAGYTDCIEEAMRFLVEQEHIEEQHPALQTLRDHLERSRTTFLESVMASTTNLYTQTGNGSMTSSNTTDWNTG